MVDSNCVLLLSSGTTKEYTKLRLLQLKPDRQMTALMSSASCESSFQLVLQSATVASTGFYRDTDMDIDADMHIYIYLYIYVYMYKHMYIHTYT